MGLSELLFGGSKEGHNDGSTTERFPSGESITRNANGSTRESTSQEVTWGGLGKAVTVTRDGDGKTINVQNGWGK
jgi:hypothetical protein